MNWKSAALALLVLAATFATAVSATSAPAAPPPNGPLYRYVNFTIPAQTGCVEMRGDFIGQEYYGPARYEAVYLFWWDPNDLLSTEPYPLHAAWRWRSSDPAESYHKEVALGDMTLIYEEQGYNESVGDERPHSEEYGRGLLRWKTTPGEYFPQGTYSALAVHASGVVDIHVAAHESCGDGPNFDRTNPRNVTITGTSSGDSVRFYRPTDFRGINIQDPTRSLIVNAEVRDDVEHHLFGTFLTGGRWPFLSTTEGILTWEGPGTVGSNVVTCFDYCHIDYADRHDNYFITGPAGEWTFSARASASLGHSDLFVLVADVELPTS